MRAVPTPDGPCLLRAGTKQGTAPVLQGRALLYFLYSPLSVTRAHISQPNSLPDSPSMSTPCPAHPAASTGQCHPHAHVGITCCEHYLPTPINLGQPPDTMSQCSPPCSAPPGAHPKSLHHCSGGHAVPSLSLQLPQSRSSCLQLVAGVGSAVELAGVG